LASLYLIPTLLDEDGKQHISPIVIEQLKSLDHFVVERLRTARRFIKKIQADYNIDQASFVELDKHNLEQSLRDAQQMFKEGKDIGLMSEAGSPCLADPGAKIVQLAREKGYIIKPLSGPSSIMLAIMASGLNGQEFTFHGYLPVKDGALQSKLRELEGAVKKSRYSQIWIETPYRNDKMLESLLKTVDKNLQLSIAVSLNGPQEKIDTRRLADWKGHKIGKEPAIFILGMLT